MEAGCSAMDIWFIIYPVVHVFKDLGPDSSYEYSRFRVVILLRSIP